MEKEIEITVENKLVMEERDMNVYHHATKSAYIVSCGNSVTVPLRTELENDYLHVSLISGPGYLDCNSMVSLPSWAKFEFSSMRDVTVSHSDGKMLVKIPPGLPLWELRLTRPHSPLIKQLRGSVVIGDDRMERLPG